MDWDKLRIFHAVASAGSFTHAGQMLALSQSAVSRQISALEEEINTPLFQRHARGLTLTDEGELLYGAVSDVLTRLGQAEEALKNAQAAPRGSLKITSSHGLGTYWLLPRINEFVRDFPELQVHLVFEDRELDLAQREADLAIRMRAPVQADLIQRKLFTVHYHLYATSEYVARHGTPQSMEDLSAHTLIAYGETAAPEIRDVNWLIDSTRRMTNGGGRALRINNITGIMHATEAGIGIAALPDYIAESRSNLVRLLP
jgi:DNA-binding transcriptional LysR family regulator